MRILLFFDLPMNDYQDIRHYTKFRKKIIKEGFIMMQKSVYTKLCLNQTSVNLMKKKLLSIKPKKGLIQILVITEKQFASIDNLIGENCLKHEDSIKRMIVL